MNWYKNIKIASIDFSIGGTEKISQPMNALDICQELLNFIWYNMEIGGRLRLDMESISPDISETSYNDPMGRINIYLTPVMGKYVTMGIIDEYNKYKAGDIELKFIRITPSKIRGTDVARILITKNETTKMEQVPSLNMANGNAAILLNMLKNEGMEIDINTYNGVMDSNLLKAVIEYLEQNDYLMDPYTQKPTEETGGEGASVYNQGMDIERLKMYFNELKKMINYIETHNLPNKMINYG